MKTSAYSELYLDDAKATLGEMCDYAIRIHHLDADDAFTRFGYSAVGRRFGCGVPRYVTGMAGADLWREVILETSVTGYPGSEAFDCADAGRGREVPLERSRAYWSGWIYAHYQWEKNLSFVELYERGLTMSRVMDMYVLHEADVTKFIDAADAIVDARPAGGTMLKRLRAYAGLTQRELSERSGVALRMVQLYEQGRNDLSRAQAGVVLALADTLHCEVRELIYGHMN